MFVACVYVSIQFKTILKLVNHKILFYEYQNLFIASELYCTVFLFYDFITKKFYQLRIVQIRLLISLYNDIKNITNDTGKLKKK